MADVTSGSFGTMEMESQADCIVEYTSGCMLHILANVTGHLIRQCIQKTCILCTYIYSAEAGRVIMIVCWCECNHTNIQNELFFSSLLPQCDSIRTLNDSPGHYDITDV